MPRLRNVPDLRLALILLVLFPLLLVFGGGGLLALGAVEAQLEQRMQEDIELIARTLKSPMERALEQEREGAVKRALRSASDFGRVYGVYVYDAEGEIVTQADQIPGRGTIAGVSTELRQLQEQGHLEDYRSMGGQEVFSFFTPLTTTGGQVIGMLQITRQVSEMRDYINALRWRVVPLLLAFSILFVAIVIAGHHFGIGRPLRRLASSMDKVACGKTEVRSVPGGPREIRRLGERFNAMLDGIHERDEYLSSQREARLRLMDRLRQSEKYAMAGRLAAGVAHELGTPLSVVDGHVQRLLRQRTGSADREILLTIRDAARQMAAVVQHLLGFGRDSTVDAKPVLVERLIALAAADVRTVFGESGTALEVVAGPSQTVVTVDERRLREALTHLLKNALHASSGGVVQLGWRTGRHGSTTIFVEDSGDGIAEEDRERIFEPFFTTKEPGQGSGLGLAVVHGIVADHGADIRVYDSPLGGAGLCVEFPPGAVPV